jgi:hypothetical protein
MRRIRSMEAEVKVFEGGFGGGAVAPGTDVFEGVIHFGHIPIRVRAHPHFGRDVCEGLLFFHVFD